MITITKINTDRFILRQVTESDNEAIFRILHDEKTTRYLNMEKVKTISDVDELIEDYLLQYANGDKFPFAIVSKKTDELIGVFLIKLDLFDPDCFEFTVYIRRALWNQGIFSEVLPYMIDFAFRRIGTGNFRGFVMKSNKVTSTVLRKYGFVLEKTFSVDGLPEKIESYLLTKEDYFKGIKSSEENDLKTMTMKKRAVQDE